MRFIVAVCAVVVVLFTVGAFYAGYRIGALEGAQTVQVSHPAASETPERDEGDTARAFFSDETRQQAISGDIKLGKALQKHLKHLSFTKDDALFVIATKPENGPQPLAVVRLNDLAGKTLPIHYEIGPNDLMIKDQGSFAGPLTLKVKLSHNGDARTAAGDLVGYPHQKAAAMPGTKVDLELSEVAQSDSH